MCEVIGSSAFVKCENKLKIFSINVMDEMENIQRLARQALKTFKNLKGSPLRQNLDVLKSMMATITAEDVKLTPLTTDRRKSFPGAPPVTHMNILECPYFSMAVFIVRKGAQLPLHDHPRMHGFCKVLYGTIEVDMYTKIGRSEHMNGETFHESKPQKFWYQGRHVFTSDSGVCTVSPVRGNLHTIRAISGPAAFLDILGPPYSTEEGRDCCYYQECHSNGEKRNEESDVRFLQEIPCPQEFFCDSQVYKGPVVKLEDLTGASDEE